MMEKIKENEFMDYIPLGEKNLNNRMYTNEGFTEEALVDYRQRIDDGSAFGEFVKKNGMDDINFIELDLNKVILKVTDFKLIDNTFWVYCRLLSDSPNHEETIKNINLFPGLFSIRPRSIGTVNPSTNDVEVRKIISFDIMHKTDDAFRNIIEKQENV